MDVNFDYMDDLNLPELEGVVKIPLDKFVRRKWVDEGQEDLWIKNYEINRDKIKPAIRTNDAMERACILVGSSPAIRKQVEVLKRLNHNFILISSNGAYKFLLENDIIPDYVVLIESRDHVVGDISESSNGTRLVTSPFVDPKVLETWKGDYETYMVGGGDRLNELMVNDGHTDIDVGGGNVINASLLWAYKYLMCRNFIMIGVSLCYYDDYYIDGRSTEHVMTDFENKKGYHKAADMYGEVVETTSPLLMYKTWLETYSKLMGIDLINSTEDGILGVYPEPVSIDDEGLKFKVKYLPWINIAPLSNAIEAFTRKFNDFGGK